MFSAYIINPKLMVLKSPLLPKGQYSFFPPTGDEVASPNLVIKILKYYEQEVKKYASTN